MARKKIVLVIVEGPSDASALERYFVKYFDSDRIVTKIIHGDITTDKNIDQSKIKAHLGNKVKSWITKDKFKKSDIDRIVHIVDMDGAVLESIFPEFQTMEPSQIRQELLNRFKRI